MRDANANFTTNILFTEEANFEGGNSLIIPPEHVEYSKDIVSFLSVF